MTEALHAKLDAFALNIAAGETTTETSLGNAFIAAENVGFRLFSPLIMLATVPGIRPT